MDLPSHPVKKKVSAKDKKQEKHYFAYKNNAIEGNKKKQGNE